MNERRQFPRCNGSLSRARQLRAEALCVSERERIWILTLSLSLESRAAVSCRSALALCVCNTLQHTATHCNTLSHICTATHLQHEALCRRARRASPTELSFGSWYLTGTNLFRLTILFRFIGSFVERSFL